MTRTKTEWFDTYKVPIPTSIKNLFPDTKAGWRLRNLYTAILIDCNNQDATYTIVNRGIEINLTRGQILLVPDRYIRCTGLESRQGLYKCINQLSKGCLISCQKVDKGGSHKYTVISIQNHLKITSLLPKSSQSSCQRVGTNIDKDIYKEKEHIYNDFTEKENIVLCVLFDRFKDLYPKKTNLNDAWEVFGGYTDEQKENAITALKKFKRDDWKDTKTRYIPQAKKFLLDNDAGNYQEEEELDYYTATYGSKEHPKSWQVWKPGDDPECIADPNLEWSTEYWIDIKKLKQS